MKQENIIFIKIQKKSLLLATGLKVNEYEYIYIYIYIYICVCVCVNLVLWYQQQLCSMIKDV